MTINKRIEKMLEEKELYDITPICEDVFGSGVSCFITENLYETLDFCSSQSPSNADSAFVEMMREIKADFAADCFEGVNSIAESLSQECDSCFCVEILGIPGFYVYIYPLPELKAILIADKYELLENIVGVIQTDGDT